MAVLGMVVVARPVKVRGHGAVVYCFVLSSVVLAQLQTDDLSQRVGFIGRFEGTRKEARFAQWLRCMLGVDAGRTQEQKPLDSASVGRFDGVDGHANILGKKLDGEGGIGKDSAYFCGCENDCIRFCFLKKAVDLTGLCQIKILPRP